MDERIAKMLLKAVRGLPQREQDQVLTALLREAFSEPWRGFGPGSAPDVLLSFPTVASMQGATLGGPGPTTMLPVRLPPELHGRLRVWCTDQGFSMASVVRGLVERFLDEQGQRAKPRTRSATPSRSKKRPTARG